MKKLTILLLSVLLLSCKKETPVATDVETNPSLAFSLKSNPEWLILNSDTLFLTTYLNRDFMPISEENGSPLYCVSYLTNKDTLAPSLPVTLLKNYVINGDIIWIKPYSEIENQPEWVWKGVVRGGPKWSPNSWVDVVCEFEFQGNIYKILATSQKIEATY